MKQLFSNATVLWTEREIAERDTLVNLCFQSLKEVYTEVNPAIKFVRVETPILTPAEHLKSHLDAGFPMLETARGYLRPETTAGTLAAFHTLYPNESQRKKLLPICVWQLGKSFRDETNPQTMRASRLRLVEFHQLEFQLFTAHGTKTDYLQLALNDLVKRFGGEIVEVPESDRPHYSLRTLDWEINGIEVAGCSMRNDWSEGILFEVSIGVDRLVSIVSTGA